MKKPSTKTVCRMGKLQDQRLTIGPDLGDRSSFYCVLTGAGEVIVEEKVVTSPEAMKKGFRQDGAEPDSTGNRHALAMGKPPPIRPGAVRRRLRPAAVGTEAGRAGGQKGKGTRHHRRGTQACSAAAPSLDQLRGVRAAPQYAKAETGSGIVQTKA